MVELVTSKIKRVAAQPSLRSLTFEATESCKRLLFIFHISVNIRLNPEECL